MNKRILPDNIKETIFFDIPVDVDIEILEKDGYDSLVDFCIDSKGIVRKSQGLVSFNEDTKNHPEYVPSNRYDIEISPWNSHQLYVEIELPNPFTEPEFALLIRTAFMNEIGKRLDKIVKNAKARISRKNK